MQSDETRHTAGAPLAHVAEGTDGNWRVHLLSEHLNDVAQLAAAFAEPFGGQEWARLAGRWHDLGKFQPAFQEYIRQSSGFADEADSEEAGPGRVDHSTVGAIHATAHLREIDGRRGSAAGRLLAYVIAGHHAGLPDYHQAQGGGGSLEYRLAARTHLYSATRAEEAAVEWLNGPPPSGGPPSRATAALWTRMLFSALVDADFLDTEDFMSPNRRRDRRGWRSLNELREVFSRYTEALSDDSTEVNRIRAQILEWCTDAATWEPGLFSLNVPTGGGKTLSSMAFALAHAGRYSKRRIIYVIPYTSIIEQTVDVFRKAFGENQAEKAVLEHHSSLDPDRQTLRSKLASENWDAPVVVTTSVQFFESLFAARTSRVRKLHNLVDSVIVLDEAQLVPPDFLAPILDVLQALSDHFGATVLSMTATRPSWSTTEVKADTLLKLTGVREIVPDPEKLHSTLRRVDVELPHDMNEADTWKSVADRLLSHPSVLCVVNRRNDARTLYELLRAHDTEAIHLSALMCGAHRSVVIDEIRERMESEQETRVVSTQLIEAGVDLDFPVVLRAMAGLDSIAQAGGRCNREGRIDRGVVQVFNPPTSPPPGVLRKAESVTRTLIAAGNLDPLAPSAFERFFDQLYWLHGDRLDAKDIRELLDHEGRGDLEFAFRTAAERFRIIRDEDQVSIVCLWGSPEFRKRIDRAVARIQHGPPSRLPYRSLQRSVVNIHRHHLGPLLASGAVVELHDRLYLQQDKSLYDDKLGLCVDPQNARNPEDLVP